MNRIKWGGERYFDANRKKYFTVMFHSNLLISKTSGSEGLMTVTKDLVVSIKC